MQGTTVHGDAGRIADVPHISDDDVASDTVAGCAAVVHNCAGRTAAKDVVVDSAAGYSAGGGSGRVVCSGGSESKRCHGSPGG